MDRRGYLLLGVTALCGGLTSGWREIEPSGVVGGARTTTGLLSLASLDGRTDPYFDADPAQFSGDSDTTTATFESGGGFTMVLATHDGDGEFTVTSTEPGESPTTLVDVSGPGTYLTGVPAATLTYDLEITASGPWALTLAQPDSPADEIREPPAEAGGTGSAIVGPLDTRKGALVSAVHDGDSEFTVRLGLEAGTGVFRPETMFEETGPVDADARTATAGVVWVVVDATGSWTLTFETER